MPDDVPFSTPVFQQTRFELMEVVSSSGYPGAEVAQYAPPRWVAEYETPLRNRFDIAEAMNFVRSIASGATFYAFDFMRPWGRNYDVSPTTLDRAASAGGGAFTNGNASSISAITTTTISVTGLPQAYKFKAGDMVGLTQSGKKSLHYVVTDVTATSGGATTVTVYPPVSTANFTTSATFTVYRARCIMRLDPGSITTTRSGRFERIGFRGTQVFYS